MGRRLPRASLKGLLLFAFVTLAISAGVRSAEENGLYLVVFCDVSASLKPETIYSEPDIIFQIIKSNSLFPSGKFAIHIADRDVEQDPVVFGSKEITHYRDEELRQTDELNKIRDNLKQTLAQYCKQHPSRNKTCLIKAIHSVPRLFPDQTVSAGSRLLIVSDMLEDCYAQGDPGNADQLRSRIARSLKDYPIAGIAGLQVRAIVISSSSNRLDMDSLRTAWENVLDSVKAKFSISTIEALLQNSSRQ